MIISRHVVVIVGIGVLSTLTLSCKFKPKKTTTTTTSGTVDDQKLSDARISCKLNDCEAAHAVVVALPVDSPLRSSSDAQTIETIWSVGRLNTARSTTEPTTKHILLTAVKDAPTVPEPQRADATRLLAELDAPPPPASAKTDDPTSFGIPDPAVGSKAPGHAPRLRQGATQVNGRLPPEVIQRIVRQNFGRFRLCYENGLRTSPNLSGRVSVKFVIDRSGAVQSAQDGGSDFTDTTVVSCVVRAFGNLTFPEPEGGIVTVVYPIIFSPGE